MTIGRYDDNDNLVPIRVMYLSVEELWRLAHAVRPIEEAFGNHIIYLVGSVLDRADYRDVDLRLILPDNEYTRLFFAVGKPRHGLFDQFRMLIQTSINTMLRVTTGLPIDFQVQSETEAERYADHNRNPVCIRPYIDPDFQPAWRDDLRGD